VRRPGPAPVRRPRQRGAAMQRHVSRRELRTPAPPREWEETGRVDMPAKVSGRAEYLDDLALPPGCLHAAAIRATVPHATITGIDAAVARRMEGVRAVLTRDDRFGLDPTIRIGEDADDQSQPRGEQTVLTVDRARFEGDFLGLVVADDLDTARR